METINLSEEQKKVFEKYNLYLMAVFGDNGIGWNSYVYYDDGPDSLDGPTPNGPNGWDRRSELNEHEPGYDILNSFAEEIFRKYDDRYYDFLDDDYARSGAITINYNPETKTFHIGIEVYVRKAEETNITKSFSELVNQERPWWAGNNERLYERLKDDDFIKELIDSHDGKTEYDFNYHGYGDSGEIDSGLPYSDDILGIAYEILDLYHGGWENNEGADGQIMIDFNKKEVKIYHEQYYDEGEYEDIAEIKIV